MEPGWYGGEWTIKGEKAPKLQILGIDNNIFFLRIWKVIY